MRKTWKEAGEFIKTTHAKKKRLVLGKVSHQIGGEPPANRKEDYRTELGCHVTMRQPNQEGLKLQRGPLLLWSYDSNID